MIRRETDAALANRIVNTPGIFTHGLYDRMGPIDLTPLIELCVVLSNGEDAVQVWELKARHLWEVMTVFGPTCRGRKAVDVGIAMLAFMEPYTDRAFGSVPDALPAAKWFYRKIGARPVDRVETSTSVFTANEGGQLFEYVPGYNGNDPYPMRA